MVVVVFIIVGINDYLCFIEKDVFEFSVIYLWFRFFYRYLLWWYELLRVIYSLIIIFK